MRSLLVLAVLATPALAHAELTGARESRCEVAIALAGPIATVTESHDLIGGDGEAAMSLDLPAGAAVTGARITPPGGRESKGLAVSTASLRTATPDAARLGIAADLGALTWLASDGDGEHFELRAAPIEQARALRATVTWTVPLAYRDGRLVLRVPARGDDPGLAACDVVVRATPGGGVRSFGPAFVDGVKVATSGGRTSIASVRPLELEVVPTWIHDRPVAAAAHLPVLGGGNDTRVLSTVAVYVPPGKRDARFAPARLVIAIDTSRSLGKDGRAGALQIADALIAAVPPTTPVEVIAFDRSARRVLGAWTPARTARVTVGRALKALPAAGGSDLGAALDLATEVVADGDPARVVIVTDGVLPTRLDGHELIGHAQMPVSQVTIDAIVPLVPGAPLVARGAIDELVTVFHGQVLSVRTTELASRAAKLPRELASAPPVRDLIVTLDGDPVTMTFPDELAPGDGVVVHGLSRGPVPKKVALEGARSSDRFTIAAVALPAGTAPLALAAASAGAVALHDVPAIPDDELLALDRAHPTVTALVGLAVVDTSTATGAARAELARTAGIFTRTATTTATSGAVIAAATTELPLDGNLPATSYQVLIKYQLWPQLRACYQEALRGKPRFAGTLDLTLELARGEVSDVTIGGTPLPEGLIACVATAAYAMEVPEYPLAGIAETIAIVHKPVYLRAPADGDADGEVSEDFGFPVAEPPPPPLD